MATTFCNEPLTRHPKAMHRLITERGHYVMAASWFDTASPRDMMDYDFTAPIHYLKVQAALTHRLWCDQQVARRTGQGGGDA